MQMYTMTARTMKLLLLFSSLALSLSLAAQYPSNSIKSRLGYQTTGDGLVYRGSGAPAYSPGTMFNAWMYLDTTNFVLYGYINFQWQRLPLVNNGLNADGAYHQLGGSLVENTTVSTGTYDLIMGRTSGTNFAQISILNSGSGASFFNSYNSGAIEAEITAANGTSFLLVENVADGGNSSIYVNKDGFKADYLSPSLGVSYFRMDSTKFRLRGLVSYASHAAADAANTEYQLYKIDNSRAIYIKNSTVTSQDILGTGTTDRSARWSATNTLAAGNITDNGTKVQALLPFQLQQWTTAGRPTGVAGYEGYNTTGNGKEWYNGTRWAYALESTFARGTSTYVPFFDANGQLTEHTGIRYDASTSNFGLGGAPSAQLHMQGNKSASSWTTNGIGIRIDPATYTNTTSSGTITNQYTHLVSSPTFAASSSTTITNASNIAIGAPIAGANTTITNSYAINAARSIFSQIVVGLNSNPNTTLGDALRITATGYFYPGQTASSNASIVGAGNSNAAGLSVYGVLGTVSTSSPATSGNIYGITGEVSGANGALASGEIAAVYATGRAAINSSVNIKSSGVLSAMNMQATTSNNANIVNGFEGRINLRSNLGAARVRGYYWSGLPSSGVVGSEIIINYNPLAIETGGLSNVTNTWSYINHSTTIGSATQALRSLHVVGEARITDLTTDTPTSIVGADADGDLGAITVGTGLSLSGGTLTATATADGNGIYTGSGTLSQRTTRALIPSTGNLFFSQKFNSNADSAYFNIVNYLSGERAVNFGLTDTSSTGYSRGYFESDGAGSMNWTLETNDVNGSTTVRALEGVLSLSTTAGNISLSAPVDQEVIATGLVRAKQEAYYEINSTSSPQNLSNTYSDNFINQGGTQATFTLVFPASPEDGQILKITYNNNISTLTLDGNGNTIVGTTVTTAVEGSQRVFKFYAGEGVWIRQN